MAKVSATALAGIAFALGLAGVATWLTARRIEPAAARAIVDELNASEFAGWFDALDVLAVIEIESGFRPAAARWESHLGEASLGLMQILPSSARDRGYTGSPFGLFDPRQGIRFGMRQLKWTHDFLQSRLSRPPTQDEWIGAYNAGVGNVLNRGIIPQNYLAKWRAARRGLG